MAFATAGDLTTHLQRPFTAEETATATQALDMASSAIQIFTRRVLSVVVGDVVTFTHPSSSVQLLPEWPVTAVTSVTDDGATLINVTDFEWTTSGIVRRVSGRWRGQVVVTYTHGYNPIPGAVKLVCLDMAGRLMENPGSVVKSESIGDYTVNYGESSFSNGLTDDEKDNLLAFSPLAFA